MKAFLKILLFFFLWSFLSFSFDSSGLGLLYAIIVYLSYFSWKLIKKEFNYKRKDNLFKILEEKNLKDYIYNFVARFSHEPRDVKGWSYRNHKIDWYRINDLEKYLIEKGVELKTGKERDIYDILRATIEDVERRLTTESIQVTPQKFSNLTGREFEMLIRRLFDAMGYSTEAIGRSGDQGGDLIANRNGERILIQAKCYRDWSVGNAAVQQVVGAMKHYDCNKTMVITSSTTFTTEAHDLAQSNNTDLISKDELSKMLMTYLHENWG